MKGWRADIESFKWPHSFSSLIKKCWEHNPEDRPDMNEICDTLEKLQIGDFENDGTNTNNASGDNRNSPTNSIGSNGSSSSASNPTMLPAPAERMRRASMLNTSTSTGRKKIFSLRRAAQPMNGVRE